MLRKSFALALVVCWGVANATVTRDAEGCSGGSGGAVEILAPEQGLPINTPLTIVVHAQHLVEAEHYYPPVLDITVTDLDALEVSGELVELDSDIQNPGSLIPNLSVRRFLFFPTNGWLTDQQYEVTVAGPEPSWPWIPPVVASFFIDANPISVPTPEITGARIAYTGTNPTGQTATCVDSGCVIDFEHKFARSEVFTPTVYATIAPLPEQYTGALEFIFESVFPTTESEIVDGTHAASGFEHPMIVGALVNNNGCVRVKARNSWTQEEGPWATACAEMGPCPAVYSERETTLKDMCSMPPIEGEYLSDWCRYHSQNSVCDGVVPSPSPFSPCHPRNSEKWAIPAPQVSSIVPDGQGGASGSNAGGSTNAQGGSAGKEPNSSGGSDALGGTGGANSSAPSSQQSDASDEGCSVGAAQGANLGGVLISLAIWVWNQSRKRNRLVRYRAFGSARFSTGGSGGNGNITRQCPSSRTQGICARSTRSSRPRRVTYARSPLIWVDHERG